MSKVTRIRSGLIACLLLPIAACSTVEDQLDFIPGIGNDGPRETAPEDGRVSILSFEQGLQQNDAAGPVVLPTAYSNPVWPQQDGYPTHAIQHTAAPGNFERAWRISIGAGSSNRHRLNARPVVADGKIFTIDADGRVSAFDADSGSRVWSEELRSDRRRDQDAVGGALVFDEGRIYAHSGLNFFVALDAQTGAELWRSETIVPFHGAPTVADGRIFVTSDDNELLSMDADNGQVDWTYPGIVETARLITSPSPAVLGDVVVAPFASGELVALRVQNGNPIWQDALARDSALTALSRINDLSGSPVILGDRVYALSHSGPFVGIDMRSGERLWSVPAGSVNTPWIAGDFLFTVTTEGEVVCVNRLTGAIHWIESLPLFENPNDRKDRISYAGPVLASGRLFVASSDGRGFILDAATGMQTGEVNLGDPVYIAPIIANETVYVLTDEGRLIALR